MSGFDEALEQAINALHQGVPMDDCLARTPEHAEQLRPLLALAAALYATPTATMSPQAFEAQRERLRARARGRAASASPLAWRDHWTRALASHRLALLAAALLVAIVLGLSGATLASAKVVPSEPLYPVKRAVEALVLILPGSGQTRATRALDSAESRLAESSAVCATDPARATVLRAEMHGQRDAALRWLAGLTGPDADALRERATLLTQRELDVAATCARHIEQLAPPALPTATTAPTRAATLTATLTTTATPSATSAPARLPTHTVAASPTPEEATATLPAPPTATEAPPAQRSETSATDTPARAPTRDASSRPTDPPAAPVITAAPPPTATPPPPPPTATQPPPPPTVIPPPPPTPTVQVVEVTKPPSRPTATPAPRPNSATVTPKRP